jgi:hypothetical protein
MTYLHLVNCMPLTGDPIMSADNQRPNIDLDDELLDYEEESNAAAGGTAAGDDQNRDTMRTIKVSVLGRKVISVLRPQLQAVTLHAQYISRVLESAHPSRMLQEVILSQLLPELHEALPDFQLTWKYDQQLKPVAMNARDTFTQARTVTELAEALTSATCSCAHFKDSYKVCIADASIEQQCPQVLGTRHVLTTDLTVIEHIPLRMLMRQGLNHIPLRSASSQEILDVHLDVAAQFYNWVLEPTATAMGITLPEDGWEIICEGVVAWTDWQLQQQQQQQDWEEGEGTATGRQQQQQPGMLACNELTPDTAAALRDLQRSLHICEVDKAANTPCLICPQYAQLLVLLRLLASSDFEPTAMGITELQADLKAALDSIHPMLSQLVEGDRLPIMRLAYKSHKNNFRFLTNTSGSLLSGLNGLAQAVAACIMEALITYLGQFNSTILGLTGIATQSCIVIPNAQQVVINLPNTISSDMCADITKCFENIPTEPHQADSLPGALRWAVDRAFKQQRNTAGRPQVLSVAHNNGTFKVTWRQEPAQQQTHSTGGQRINLSKEQVIPLPTTIVTRAYVTAGVTYRQCRGIPMGADYSPTVCNIYFMMYECQAVMRMNRLALNLEHSRQLLTEWKYCFRLIDDMRFINAPNLARFLRNPTGTGDKNALGWIYPACVGIDITYDVDINNSSGGSTQTTQYLDILTHIQPDGSYTTEVYDKQSKLPIIPINYIALQSNRPVGNSYKLIVGQASRMAAICSTKWLAAKHIMAVVRQLGARGFSEGRLYRLLGNWAQHNNVIAGKAFTMTAVADVLLRRRKFWRR